MNKRDFCQIDIAIKTFLVQDRTAKYGPKLTMLAGGHLDDAAAKARNFPQMINLILKNKKTSRSWAIAAGMHHEYWDKMGKFLCKQYGQRKKKLGPKK